jgi:excisionase family DNA binding protein
LLNGRTRVHAVELARFVGTVHLAMNPVLLRPNDVARKLSVSRAWVYDAARTGRIPSVRLGGEDGPLRFIEADIDQWLAEARAAWHPGRRAS